MMVDRIIAYESGELDDSGIISLFRELVRNGMAWTLQGHYGRVASALIENGIITGKGEVTELGKEYIGED